MVTHKNKTIQALFAGIAHPPKVIVTRWSSWLKATIYFANNLPEIRKIILGLKGKNILTKRAKEAILHSKIVSYLIKIQESCFCLSQFWNAWK